MLDFVRSGLADFLGYALVQGCEEFRFVIIIATLVQAAAHETKGLRSSDFILSSPH